MKSLPAFIVRDSRSGYILREYVVGKPEDEEFVKLLETEILDGMEFMTEVLDDSELVDYMMGGKNE